MITFLPERHYPRAPITEAVIDLLTVGAVEPSVDHLEQIGDAGYPGKERVDINEFGVAREGASIKTKQLGWRFRSADGLYVYQVRKNGFGASRLAPYERWESFRGEARRLWDKYREATQPLGLQRIAVRYINRIDIPLPLEDFGDYFLTAPLISPHLPQGLSGYLLSLTVPIDPLVTAIITQTTLSPEVVGTKPANPEKLSMLLDIDVSQAIELPETEEGIWERFEYLRKVKNHVFESCITDMTRGLFQ